MNCNGLNILIVGFSVLFAMTMYLALRYLQLSWKHEDLERKYLRLKNFTFVTGYGGQPMMSDEEADY